MTVRTVEQLSDRLAEDLAWRKKELSELKSIIRSGKTSSTRRRALIRSAVAILYAHWEGFIKNSSQCYLEYVAMQRLNYSQLSSNFVAFAMKSQLNAATSSNKASVFIAVCDLLLSSADTRCRLPYKRVLRTGSNLSSAVLRELVLLLGLDFSFYETKANLIDKSLVKARNTIAHGSFLTIEQGDFLDLLQEVLTMIEIYRNQIENAAVLQEFRN